MLVSSMLSTAGVRRPRYLQHWRNAVRPDCERECRFGRKVATRHEEPHKKAPGDTGCHTNLSSKRMELGIIYLSIYLSIY